MPKVKAKRSCLLDWVKMADWHLQNTWSHGQIAFIATIGAFCFIILAVSLLNVCCFKASQTLASCFLNANISIQSSCLRELWSWNLFVCKVNQIPAVFQKTIAYRLILPSHVCTFYLNDFFLRHSLTYLILNSNADHDGYSPLLSRRLLLRGDNFVPILWV